MLRRIFATLLFTFWAFSGALGAAEDLAVFKSSDELWQHLESLKRGPGHEFASKAELIGYLSNITTATTEFTKRYPKDPRRWEAKLMNAQSSAVLKEMKGGKVNGDLQEAVCKAIVAAPDAPAAVKTEARFGLIQVHLVPALKTGKINPDLDLEMAAFKKDFPDDPRTNSLDFMRARFLHKSNPERARAILETLAKSQNPRVAEQANALLHPAP